MSDLIINLTDSTLDDALNHAELPVLLDLWAPGAARAWPLRRCWRRSPRPPKAS